MFEFRVQVLRTSQGLSDDGNLSRVRVRVKERGVVSHAMEIMCVACKTIHIFGECPLNGLCLYCKERKATLHFGDMLSFTHGGAENCCELCCARMQLEHAQERAAAIPELSAKVAQLKQEEKFKERVKEAGKALEKGDEAVADFLRGDLPIERAFKDDGEPF